MNESRIAIVIPCYNEGKRITPRVFTEYIKNTPNVTLIFVNDGSTDNTLEVLNTIMRESERVEVLSLDKNHGKGNAVREGMNNAISGDYAMIGYWDADLATPLDLIETFASIITERNKRIVLGARVKALGRCIDRRASRHYLGRIFATFASIILKLPVYDTQCGAKLFKNDSVLEKVFSLPFCSRWSFDVELIARFIKEENRGYVIEYAIEYSVDKWNDVAGSKLTVRASLGALCDLIRIYFKYKHILKENSSDGTDG